MVISPKFSFKLSVQINIGAKFLGFIFFTQELD